MSRSRDVVIGVVGGLIGAVLAVLVQAALDYRAEERAEERDRLNRALIVEREGRLALRIVSDEVFVNETAMETLLSARSLPTGITDVAAFVRENFPTRDWEAQKNTLAGTLDQSFWLDLANEYGGINAMRQFLMTYQPGERLSRMELSLVRDQLDLTRALRADVNAFLKTTPESSIRRSYERQQRDGS